MLPFVYRNRILFSKLIKLVITVALDLSGVIQIKFIAGRHSQDLSVFGIHGNGSRHMASHGGLPFINILLEDILDIQINGGNNGFSVCRLF